MSNCSNPNISLRVMLFHRKMFTGNCIFISNINFFVCLQNISIIKKKLFAHLKVVYLLSWIPHAVYVLRTMLSNEQVNSSLLSIVVCKSYTFTTPLLVYLFDRRLRLSYYRNEQRNLIYEDYLVYEQNNLNSALFKIYE